MFIEEVKIPRVLEIEDDEIFGKNIVLTENKSIYTDKPNKLLIFMRFDK